MEDLAKLIRSIEPIPFRSPLATGAEYAAWVTAAVARAEQALIETGLDEVHLVPIDLLDLEFHRDEMQLIGQAFVVLGTSDVNRWEAVALIHFTANGEIRISTRP